MVHSSLSSRPLPPSPPPLLPPPSLLPLPPPPPPPPPTHQRMSQQWTSIQLWSSPPLLHSPSFPLPPPVFSSSLRGLQIAYLVASFPFGVLMLPKDSAHCRRPKLIPSWLCPHV